MKNVGTTEAAARPCASWEPCTSISQLTCSAAEQNIWHLPIGQQPSSDNYSLWEKPWARTHSHAQQQQHKGGYTAAADTLPPQARHPSCVTAETQFIPIRTRATQETHKTSAVKRHPGMNGEIPSVAARLRQEAHARCRATGEGVTHAHTYTFH